MSQLGTAPANNDELENGGSRHESTEHQPPRSAASSSTSASNSASWLSTTASATAIPPPLTPLLAPERRYPGPRLDPVAITVCCTVSAPVLAPMTASSEVPSSREEAGHILVDDVGSDSVSLYRVDLRLLSHPCKYRRNPVNLFPLSQ